MKKYKLISLLILGAVFCMYSITDIQAQARKLSTLAISSQVLNEDGEPMPNVVVKSFRAKGSVVTASDGSFTIQVAQDIADEIVIEHKGYELATVVAGGGILSIEPIVLVRKRIIDPANKAVMPYLTVADYRSVGAVTTVTGEEMESYPTGAMLTALSGRIPGLVVSQSSHIPGQESVYATIRGTMASIYIDGILRDPVGLQLSEIERIDVMKDLPGRSQMGIAGADPIIWITTKKGTPYNSSITFSSEYGFNTPTVMPKYLGAYDYARLYNEALENDGITPAYDATALNAYRDGTDPLHYPDINYYDKYFGTSAPFRKGHLGFSGGDNRVSYYSSFNYQGSGGFETIGENLRSNLYKLRANVDIALNDFIRLNVNIMGSYEKQRFANSGSGGNFYNLFDVLSVYPSNAHAMYFGDKMLISDDYDFNIENEFLYAGFAEHINMNTQNNARLTVDLGNVLEGLTFIGNASIDAYNTIANNKGGTAALYRLQTTALGADTAVLITPESIVTGMSMGYDYVNRRTATSMGLNYQYSQDVHELTANLFYFMGTEEIKAVDNDYQPLKMQDFVLSANYAYDKKYVIQADLAYSGSMKMREGERFSLYPTIGAAWIISNESFLSGNDFIDYLKLYTSAGVMGYNDFSLSGYNTYYLYESLWRSAGTWRTGYSGNYSSYVNVYNVVQEGTVDFTLPKKRYFNLGVQSTMLDKALSVELNYFNNLYYDKISNMAMTTPSIYGSSSFLPAVNYGKDVRWGFDGMLQYTGQAGSITYSAGVNAMYQRSKYLEYDEAAALPEYRKRAGKDMDLYWVYEADGLFQSQTEIVNHAFQSWGELQPGDIRYVDYNEDGIVDEADVHTTGEHTPRIFYGINASVGYRGFRLFALGQGVADGHEALTSSRYFRINGTRQNYSEFLLNRYPETNDVPRLTTQSTNNTQNSTFWLASAAYFRLKNVEISYTLPVTISHKYLMSDLTVFARGTNLAVLSGLNQYSVDPEDINAGITRYPMLRTITFGLSARF
ncbi:MAG: SusC/RagA family TonB-linked outer membrane protein [Bacteroidales bacterium]|jgi:TonB-linked SusC/RagA family outer membrane protein|nr:SusC/RagA family TonB-linked outer membrane protein [Bacteroidales bacterium]